MLWTLGLAAPAHAAFPGANGRIAFSTHESSPQIYTINPDGTGETHLAAGREPAWSADGTKIAYVNPAGDLAVMNADGSGQTDLVAPVAGFQYSTIFAPAWSPDGMDIAFYDDEESFDQHQSDVYLVRVTDPTGPTPRLPFCDFCFAENPAWSPDGRWIAADVTDYQTGVDGIQKITPAGTSLTDVYPGQSPDWSPDAIQLAIIGSAPFTSDGPVAVINSDGTGYTPLDQPATNHSDVFPIWSPDRRKIAFVQYDFTVSPTQHRLYVMNADGSGKTLVPVTSALSNVSDPSWQPIPYTGYPRPRGATPLRVSLVPAYQSCSSPNSTHGAPLSFGSCGPAAQASGHLTVGTPPQNSANSIGAVTARVISGDVQFAVSITDVRNQGSLSDYSGQLETRLPLRVTDKDGGVQGTTQNFPFSFAVPCAATTDTTVGSTCSVVTTADTLMPDAVTTGLRAIWALGQIGIYDGGADGVASTTGDNTLFMDEGIFVP